MGLDMYLQAERYIYYGEDKLRNKITEAYDIGLKPKRLVFEVMCWRKANAIHDWFVKNIQDGVDECQRVSVSVEKLQELLDAIDEVLGSSKLIKEDVTNGYTLDKDFNQVPIIEDGEVVEDSSKAKDLLPTSEGFFFGSTDYDEYYWNDLMRTADELRVLLDKIETDEEFKKLNFYYRSSW